MPGGCWDASSDGRTGEQPPGHPHPFTAPENAIRQVRSGNRSREPGKDSRNRGNPSNGNREPGNPGEPWGNPWGNVGQPVGNPAHPFARASGGRIQHPVAGGIRGTVLPDSSFGNRRRSRDCAGSLSIRDTAPNGDKPRQPQPTAPHPFTARTNKRTGERGTHRDRDGSERDATATGRDEPNKRGTSETSRDAPRPCPDADRRIPAPIRATWMHIPRVVFTLYGRLRGTVPMRTHVRIRTDVRTNVRSYRSAPPTPPRPRPRFQHISFGRLVHTGIDP